MAILKLSLQEKLLLKQILPQTSSLTDQIIIAGIKKKIVFSEDAKKIMKAWEAVEEELRKVGGLEAVFTEPPAEITNVTEDLKLTNLEIKILKDRIDELDKEKKIHISFVSLCEKIKDLK